MNWDRDLPTWPNARASHRITCRPHDWHVQIIGDGPDVVFLHGAGASTHSWAGLIARMAPHYRCIAIDLPGHGFTRLGTRTRSTLDKMAEDLSRLIDQSGWRPVLFVGHSAGAAIALRLALSWRHGVPVFALNAALESFDGLAGWLFPILAKGLALNPLTALAFSTGPNPGARARRLIHGTGSHPPEDMMACYARLISDRAHVDGALTMMAHWSLTRLIDDLPALTGPCLLATGSQDKAVSPSVSQRAADRIPSAHHLDLGGFGHLAHEEAPDTVAGHLKEWFDRLDQP